MVSDDNSPTFILSSIFARNFIAEVLVELARLGISFDNKVIKRLSRCLRDNDINFRNESAKYLTEIAKDKIIKIPKLGMISNLARGLNK